MENAVNTLCYNAMADAKKHSGRVIDEVMAFAIIDALAKAPDWNFDGRNSAAYKIATEIAALPNFPLWFDKTREKYLKQRGSFFSRTPIKSWISQLFRANIPSTNWLILLEVCVFG